MYRPTASAKFARDFMRQAVAAGTNALAVAGEALLGALIKVGIYEQAMRENRRIDRANKRRHKFTTYQMTGGKREGIRRRRQISAGSLRIENGLIPS